MQNSRYLTQSALRFKKQFCPGCMECTWCLQDSLCVCGFLSSDRSFGATVRSAKIASLWLLRFLQRNQTFQVDQVELPRSFQQLLLALSAGDQRSFSTRSEESNSRDPRNCPGWIGVSNHSRLSFAQVSTCSRKTVCKNPTVAPLGCAVLVKRNTMTRNHFWLVVVSQFPNWKIEVMLTQPPIRFRKPVCLGPKKPAWGSPNVSYLWWWLQPTCQQRPSAEVTGEGDLRGRGTAAGKCRSCAWANFASELLALRTTYSHLSYRYKLTTTHLFTNWPVGSKNDGS